MRKPYCLQVETAACPVAALESVVLQLPPERSPCPRWESDCGALSASGLAAGSSFPKPQSQLTK